MTIDERIAQFQKMVELDSSNELAHFSLGTALFEAGRFKDAAQSFQRVLALNNRQSRAYLMLGRAQRGCGDLEYAVQTLRNGYLVAHKQGDRMPLNEIADVLTELGAALPELEKKAPPPADAAGGEPGFACSRCGGNGPRLKERPFKGALGERILARVCERCWREWIAMGTKVINELRLPMHDPQAQEAFDRHMQEFLGIAEA